MGAFGFSAVGKTYLIPANGKLYGDFTGTQNRIMLWDNDGRPLADVNLGTDNAAGNGMFGEARQEGAHLRHFTMLKDGTFAAVTRRARAFFWTPELKLKKMVVLPTAPFCGADDGTNLYAGLDDGTILRIAPNGAITPVGRMSAQVRELAVSGGKLVAGDKVGNLMEFSQKK